MVDTFSKEQRSAIMSKIRSTDTQLEKIFRKKLSSFKLKYRKNYKLLGKPDIVFVSKRLTIFIDSCFWHGCPKHLRIPKSNKSYWIQKIQKNIKRDAYVTNELKKEGWAVMRFWEHDIRNGLEKSAKKVFSKYNKL
jgi:DNA mismatch endonuclease (patch repair protein)